MTGQFDDATLAAAAAAGDSAALGLIYDRYGGRLLGLCMSMLRSRADAEDCLQDVFVVAATRLRDLREPELLRSWLFAVARHECLARLDRRRREVPVDEIPDLAETGGDLPATALLDAELAALLRDAAAGLSDRDRLVLELAHRQELSGEELARAIGVPRSTAYTLVDRARATAVRAIGALLVARSNRGQCPRLALILSGWDGKLTALHRKQIARHIDDCEVCDGRRNRIATPAAILGQGQAAIAGFVVLRPQILAAAGRAWHGGGGSAGSVGAHGGVGTAGKAQNWVNGWPPADFRSSVPHRDRHQGHGDDNGDGQGQGQGSQQGPRLGRGPLVLLVALLILVVFGTAAGALVYQNRNKQPALSFTGNPSSTAVPKPPPTATLRSAPAAPASSRAANTVTPPPPTATTRTAPARTATPTTTATPNSTIWVLTVYTAHGSVSVNINGSASTCLPGHVKTPCSYSVPNGQSVAVTIPDDNGSFSSPAGCTNTGPDCDFTMKTDTAVRVAVS